MKSIILSLILVAAGWVGVTAQQELDLFGFWRYYSDVENSTYKTSCQLAFEQLRQREVIIAALESTEEHLSRQALVRDKLLRLLGPLPEKTPLNPQITGIITREDYLVEKISFESIPGFHVTAGLFLPRSRKGKLPVVIYASGHTVNGFRSDTYQHVIINLVKKGFAVFAFDPIGQGERWQYFKDNGYRRYHSSTIEHSYPGAQCYISGYSPTKYFVWDAIRSIDYLVTREEIDPERIGMTGRSGGGTQTAYTAAVDDRILAAAPECYITNMEYILKSIGPQDAEQNLYRMISEGLDHADLMEVRAPKPALMITTTRDFFSIQGARETFAEVKRFYSALDAAENIGMVEDDDEHASTRKNREAMYAFFQQHLDNPGSPKDQDVEVFEEQELWVTQTGKVTTAYQSKTLYDLNRNIAENQLQKLQRERNLRDKAASLLPYVQQVSGLQHPGPVTTSIFSGRLHQPHYSIEKYLVSSGSDYQLPLAVLSPNSGISKQVVLIFDHEGMEHAASRPWIDSLISVGNSIVLADLPGIGSMGPGYLKGDAYVDNTSFNQWFAGILTGKSIVAMRAEDMIRISNFVKHNFPQVVTMAALSTGPLGSELLHLATFDDNIDRVAMIRPFISYASVAMSPEYLPSFIPSTVAGAIDRYDLPDLMAAICPAKTLLINPLDPTGELYKLDQAAQLLEYPIEVFSRRDASEHLKLSCEIGQDETVQELIEWLK